MIQLDLNRVAKTFNKHMDVLNKQEKEMQKFENGDSVSVHQVKGWIDSVYVEFDKEENKHVAKTIGGQYTGYLDSEIRPAQLICDEAREKIKKFSETRCFKFETESSEQFNELKELLNAKASHDLPKFNVYRCIPKDILFFSNEDFYNKSTDPELNLKTGEVVPCDDFENECIVSGCTNKKHEGKFAGDLCQPCFYMLISGEVKNTKTFLGDMQNKLKKQEAEIEQLTLEMKNIRNLANLAYKKTAARVAQITKERER